MSIESHNRLYRVNSTHGYHQRRGIKRTRIVEPQRINLGVTCLMLHQSEATGQDQPLVAKPHLTKALFLKLLITCFHTRGFQYLYTK
jgi:hypothetical protein